MASFAAWRSNDGDPYPQSVAFERKARHFAVASGGGGGAAQMLRRGELEKLLDTAWYSAAAAWTTDEHLRAFMQAAEAGVQLLRKEPEWTGTTGHLVAAWWDPATHCAWLSGAGYAEAYLVHDSKIAVVHRETTLANLDPPAPRGLADVLVAALGMWSEPAPPTRVELAPGDRLVLASCAMPAGDDMVEWLRVRTSMTARELWQALRTTAAVPARFDRQAVIGVIEL